MARTIPKRRQLDAARPPAHPLLLDSDLRHWAGERTARGGRKDALLGRVEALRLSLDGGALEARVRGNRPLPYAVDARVEESRLVSRCTCAGDDPAPCRHAVAALEALRFPHPAPCATPGRSAGRPAAGRGRIVQHAPAAPGFVLLGGAEPALTRDDRLALARDEQRSLRRQRAREQRARVVVLPSFGGAPRFAVQGRRREANAKTPCVTLRGAAAHAACTCGDYERNELETCWHIEKWRAWCARQRKDDRPAVAPDLLSLWVRSREWLDREPDPLGEVRIDLAAGARLAAPAAPPELDRYFDGDGWLRAAPAGASGPRWAGDAIAAARRAGRERGWRFDLDPAVRARIAAVAAEQALASARAAAATPAAWAPVRDGLGLRLHAYQEAGSLFLARTGRALLADDMGLGKTVQAIAAALLLRRGAGARRALVVCPASLKHQWSREIERVAGERAVVVDGPRPSRLLAYANWREGFLVLNYELVLKDLEEIRAASPELIVLDEAQRIKNWETRTAGAIKQLASPHAFVLTGTPLENRLDELHSLVEFLHPRALGPRWRLAPFHVVTDRHGRVIAYEGFDVLRARLGRFFLRRERHAVLDQLPARTDNTFWTEMSALQRRSYRQRAAAVARLLSGAQPLGGAELRALLRALTEMRILCNAWAQYEWVRFAPRLEDPRPPDAQELRALGSPKLEEFARVLEDLLEESQAKIVVFSQWERMLRLAEYAAREPLSRRDLRGALFHGKLTGRARVALLDAFAADPELRVLFSTDAGGLGLNLQDSASIVVNLEVPWNPAVLEQRIGRVHRLGQRQSVQVLHFVTREAIEERVRQVVEDKRALFEGLLVTDADRVVLGAHARASFVERVRLLVGVDDGDGDGDRNDDRAGDREGDGVQASDGLVAEDNVRKDGVLDDGTDGDREDGVVVGETSDEA